MSPVASSGPPHTRSTSTNGGGPVSMANSAKPNGGDFMKGVNRAFPHIDDLVAVKPNLDIHSPIRKILQEGELFAKQADTHLDFRRPDVALQEHVKATIVAAEIIPRHKDYPSLQSDRGELHRSYTGLMKRIKAQNEKFDDVKVLIKENNARSGVKPTLQRDLVSTASDSMSNGLQNGHSRAQSLHQPPANGISTGTVNGLQVDEHPNGVSKSPGLSLGGAPPRKKPPVQPKPEGLHGKALNQPGTTPSSSAQVDLAARFARLRSPESTPPIQDPRIRTQPIQIPESSENVQKSPMTSQNSSQPGRPFTIIRPTGPREMPSVPASAPRTAKIPLDVQIPGMPRPPDAIYSPARGTDAAVNLPSSIPRNPSYLVNGRKNSAPPISTVGPTPGSREGKQDYFSPAHTLNNDGYSKRRQDPSIPESTTVSAEDLLNYINMGSQSMRILLVDIRAREQFDSGHIMSQSIICLEPISLRHGISAEELGESIVLSPDSEQKLYDKRHEFDLIVFYNQSSWSTKPDGRGYDNDIALQYFTKAIYDYGYEKQPKRFPRLLLGGLDAWVDLMGPGSLQSSSTGLTTSGRGIDRKGPQPSQPSSRGAIATRKYAPARRRTYESRPLSKEEESKWDASLREDNARSPTTAETTSPDEFSYARTTEDFFRRYPELPAIQESMISPPSVPPRTTYQNELANSMPRPPARPAPALPRQRSSGLSEKGPSATYAMTSTSQPSITTAKVTPGNTGLQNNNVVCYMNSAIQALSSTDFIRDFLLKFTYPPDNPLPKKSTEKSVPPQLMVRNLGNLLGHLWSGQYDYVTPKTFAAYCNAISVPHMANLRTREDAFGGGNVQHDSAEFLNFLVEVLDDELNPSRDNEKLNIVSGTTDEEEKLLNARPYLWGCDDRWRAFLTTESSIITREMKGLFLHARICQNCGNERRSWTPFTYITLEITKTTTHSLESAIRSAYGVAETIDGANCESRICNGTPQQQHRTDYFGHLPNYLVIQLKRYQFNRDNNETTKITTPITFPEHGLDLTPVFAPATGAAELGLPLYEGQKGPFKYDCYAVTQHRGQSPKSGHYWTLARRRIPRSRQYSWTAFNDSRVYSSSFETTQNQDTAVIFLKRQDGPR